MAAINIVGLNHDLNAKKSYVMLVWANEPDKRLGLPVTFGCSLDDLPAEAEKAVRALSTELETIQLNSI